MSRRSAMVAGVAALAFVLWGGYGRHWHWTGINGHTATLWDWLELLVLPLAVALAPVMLELRDNWTRRHTLMCLALLGAFGAIVLDDGEQAHSRPRGPASTATTSASAAEITRET